ncbi:hypothetical protein GCM10022407_34770 [Hymenobacter antarcticus]|uniref:Uncharacterized protein n=1 Tax=Hymenobacter antarcticus TaxID=486270 RepID=A0ABP7QRN7_9BACT
MAGGVFVGLWLGNRGGWAVLKGSWPALVAAVAGEMRKGWEGPAGGMTVASLGPLVSSSIAPAGCAARERSGPLDSPTPGATNGSGGGCA